MPARAPSDSRGRNQADPYKNTMELPDEEIYRVPGRSGLGDARSTSPCVERAPFRPWMKRRTLRSLRTRSESGLHHHVYVVLLDPAVGRLKKVQAENPRRDPKKPCVYVGMTGLTPTERLANHQAGIKSASVVHRYGIRLLPELFAYLNPMPFADAVQMERDLAQDLRRAGYTVTGGH